MKKAMNYSILSFCFVGCICASFVSLIIHLFIMKCCKKKKRENYLIDREDSTELFNDWTRLLNELNEIVELHVYFNNKHKPHFFLEFW